KPAVVDAATGAARVTFEGNAKSVLKLEMTAPAGNALGLPASVSATSLAGRMEAQSAGNKLILSAVPPVVRSRTPPPALVLGQNASYSVSGPTAAGSQNKTVTVPASATIGNKRLEDLVADLNDALTSALGGSIRAEVNGTAILLRSFDKAITGFSITASAPLGLSAGAATPDAIASFQLSAASGLPELGLAALSSGPLTPGSADFTI